MAAVFRGGAEYSARQLPYFRGRCAPETFARMFPGGGDRSSVRGDEAGRAPSSV